MLLSVCVDCRDQVEAKKVYAALCVVSRGLLASCAMSYGLAADGQWMVFFATPLGMKMDMLPFDTEKLQ